MLKSLGHQSGLSVCSSVQVAALQNIKLFGKYFLVALDKDMDKSLGLILIGNILLTVLWYHGSIIITDI